MGVVAIKGTDDVIRNPATEEKQDAMITAFGGAAGFTPTLQNFKISDIDDASNPKFYGYVDKDQNWYILQENTTTKTYRYFKGVGSYATAWTGRAGHAYGYFFDIF